jgi:hypothetical protein
MLLILKTLFYGYTAYSLNHVKIFKPTINPFYINNIQYRESINHIFVLDLKHNYNKYTEEPTYEYTGDIKYGKNKLKDVIISSTWNKIDYLYISRNEPGLTHILASIYGIDIPLTQFKIMDNNNVLWSSNSYNIGHFDLYFLNIGFHNISLWGKSDLNYCICPSKKKGFTMSYQLAAWNNEYEKHVVKYDNTVNKTDVYDSIAVTNYSYNDIEKTTNYVSYLYNIPI